ncbi:hypothetical protein SAMN05443507_10978 [Alicyclobacillus tolerans]|uniref:Putative regulatory protein SAMN05443507_10978 n=2 Tax=Alicyclobacillus tolerans TaxID=90970 RepID=A0A1M6Q7D6_9BACL|nr:hypothetical protein SAMN05443507_10978 [Alicyclobacillus montanus]
MEALLICRYETERCVRFHDFRLVAGLEFGVSTQGGAVMSIKLINIGFGNIVSANRIIAIVAPESAPIKRIIQEARDRGMLIDATYGRRTRAVIIVDSGHVILSAVQPETVAHRMASKEHMIEDEE